MRTTWKRTPESKTACVVYSRARRAEMRHVRDNHIDRWLRAGIDERDIVEACGYALQTVRARANALGM